MAYPDPELEHIRETVDCASFLERLPRPWLLDRAESTKDCLKYRRGKGEILIVNHGGRGWWDPNSEAKGDIFSLVQHLQPNFNFGEARKLLRDFTALPIPSTSTCREETPGKKPRGAIPIPERWAERPKITRDSQVWNYLTRERALPPHVIEQARRADVLREGPHASAWFAHKDTGGAVTHVEIRGPEFKGSLRGGTKTLFRFPGGPPPHARLLVAEAPIDALSLAAIEGIRGDTLYTATGGGMGPATIAAIEHLLATMAALRERGSETTFCSATDANPAGERYAARHHELAVRAGIPFERLRPPIPDGDWNDVLENRSPTT